MHRRYTRQQLETIVRHRLEGGLHPSITDRRLTARPASPCPGLPAAFAPEAVEFCARKVAAVSGDARRALDICRRAAELAQRAGALVDMATVRAAIEQMTASPVLRAIQTAALHEQLFLVAMLSEFRRAGVEETVFGDVAATHVTLTRMRGLPKPSVSTLAAVRCPPVWGKSGCLPADGAWDGGGLLAAVGG